MGILQVIGAALVSVVIMLSLQAHGKDISLVLSILVCCMVLGVAVGYFQPVLGFIKRAQQLAGLDNGNLGIMLKAAGIGLVAHIAGLVCSDSGNSALGKAVQILASGAILWLSLPLMESLIGLVQSVLGEV